MDVVWHHDVGIELVSDAIEMMHRLSNKFRQVPMPQFATSVAQIKPKLDTGGDFTCESLQGGGFVRRRIETFPFATNPLELHEVGLEGANRRGGMSLNTWRRPDANVGGAARNTSLVCQGATPGTPAEVEVKHVHSPIVVGRSSRPA